MRKDEYFNIIDGIKKEYSKGFLKLKEDYVSILKNYNYDDMRKIMDTHNKLICNTIKEVLSYYSELNNINTLIILTGSLARKTNLLYSDVDINIMYDNKYRDKYLQIEDQISYMLASILNYRGRDRIHGITYYLPIISNIMVDDIQNNHYTLHFDDGNFEYSVRENAYDTMYNTFNSTRSIKDLEDYLINNQVSFKNWTNVYENLGDVKEYEKFHHNIKTAEKDNILKCDFDKEQEKLIHTFSNFTSINNEIEIPIKTLKKIYKEDVLKNMYEFMIYVYKLAIKNGINIEKFDFEEMQDKHVFEQLNIDTKLYDYFYNYFALITKLQYTLNSINLDLSKHSLKSVSQDVLNSTEKNIFNDANFLRELSSSKQEMGVEIKKVLTRRLQ